MRRRYVRAVQPDELRDYLDEAVHTGRVGEWSDAFREIAFVSIHPIIVDDRQTLKNLARGVGEVAGNLNEEFADQDWQLHRWLLRLVASDMDAADARIAHGILATFRDTLNALSQSGPEELAQGPGLRERRPAALNVLLSSEWDSDRAEKEWAGYPVWAAEDIASGVRDESRGRLRDASEAVAEFLFHLATSEPSSPWHYWLFQRTNALWTVLSAYEGLITAEPSRR